MTEMMELDTKMLKCYYNYKYLKKNIIIMSREMEDIKKNQVEHLEMKNVLSKMKNVLNEIYCRLDTAEEKIIDPKGQYSSIMYLN